VKCRILFGSVRMINSMTQMWRNYFLLWVLLPWSSWNLKVVGRVCIWVLLFSVQCLASALHLDRSDETPIIVRKYKQVLKLKASVSRASVSHQRTEYFLLQGISLYSWNLLVGS